MLASIAHRLSGVLLVLFIPLYLYVLQAMSASPDHYAATLGWMHSWIGKSSLWLLGVALVYHISNGVRFLCIDVGWCESRSMMRFSAKLVLGLAACTALLLAGVLL